MFATYKLSRHPLVVTAWESLALVAILIKWFKRCLLPGSSHSQPHQLPTPIQLLACVPFSTKLYLYVFCIFFALGDAVTQCCLLVASRCKASSLNPSSRTIRWIGITPATHFPVSESECLGTRLAFGVKIALLPVWHRS